MRIMAQLKPSLISYWTAKAFKAFYPNLRYTPCPDAPNSFKALKQFKDCLTGAIELPVYDQACNDTIYLNPLDNVAFRAWHDAIHLEKNLSFKPVDEIQVGLEHCRQLRLVGAPTHVINAVYFDVIGQIEFYSKHGQFVVNQRQFVQDCLSLGLQRAIDLEYDTATIQA